MRPESEFSDESTEYWSNGDIATIEGADDASDKTAQDLLIDYLMLKCYDLSFAVLVTKHGGETEPVLATNTTKQTYSSTPWKLAQKRDREHDQSQLPDDDGQGKRQKPGGFQPAIFRGRSDRVGIARRPGIFQARHGVQM